MDHDDGYWITCPECLEPYEMKNGIPTHHCPLDPYKTNREEDQGE